MAPGRTGWLNTASAMPLCASVVKVIADAGRRGCRDHNSVHGATSAAARRAADLAQLVQPGAGIDQIGGRRLGESGSCAGDIGPAAGRWR